MKDVQFITFGKSPLAEDFIWFVPKGNEVETDPFKKPHANAVGLGHVSDEGDTETPGYGEPEAIRDSNGMAVKHVDGDYEPKHEFAILQTGNFFEGDKIVYGEKYVIGTVDDYQINKCADNKSVGTIVIDHIFDNEARERTIYENATIKLAGEIVNNSTEVRTMPLAVTPTVGADGFSGKTYKKAKDDIEG